MDFLYGCDTFAGFVVIQIKQVVLDLKTDGRYFGDHNMRSYRIHRKVPLSLVFTTTLISDVSCSTTAVALRLCMAVSEEAEWRQNGHQKTTASAVKSAINRIEILFFSSCETAKSQKPFFFFGFCNPFIPDCKKPVLY